MTTTETEGESLASTAQAETAPEPTPVDGLEDGAAQPEQGEEAKPEEKAPEEYADFTAPDGVELDQSLMEQAVPIFKEIGLSQDQAQKLVDFYAAAQGKQAQAWQETHRQWADESRADPEIGGDRLKEKLAHVARARDQFGGEGFVDLLNQTGVGNHKEMLRFMMKVGQHLGEDLPLNSTNHDGGKTAAEILYPSLPR